MQLFIAILWTFVFVCHIISIVLGLPPTWINVFCPLIALMLEEWYKYLKEKL